MMFLLYKYSVCLIQLFKHASTMFPLKPNILTIASYSPLYSLFNNPNTIASWSMFCSSSLERDLLPKNFFGNTGGDRVAWKDLRILQVKVLSY